MALITREMFVKAMEDYETPPFEHIVDARKQKTTYLAKNAPRLFAMINAIKPYLVAGSTVMDFGAFPGTFLRLVRRFFSAESPRLIAAGLIQSEDVKADFMKYAIESVELDLDPFHDGFWNSAIPDRYYCRREEGKVDLVVASEIVEHLINPRHLFQCAYAALKPGGVLLVTTPNLARIQGRVALFLGRSPNPPVTEGLMALTQSQWRDHVRVFCMHEIEEFMAKTGFDIVFKDFIDERPWPKRTFLKNIAFMIPAWRHCQLVVARKPQT